jgi:hypothetical protein
MYVLCHTTLYLPLQACLWSMPQGNCWTLDRGTATWHLCCSGSSLSAERWSNPVTGSFLRYCGWDSAAHFTYITVLWVVGEQMHVLCKPKALPTLNIKLNAALMLKLMFTDWTLHASLSAIHLTPLIPLPFVSIRHQTQGFMPATRPCHEFRQLVSGFSPTRTNPNPGLPIWD